MIINQRPDSIRFLSWFPDILFLVSGSPVCLVVTSPWAPPVCSLCLVILTPCGVLVGCFVALSPQLVRVDVFLRMRLGCCVCVGGSPQSDSAVPITSCQGYMWLTWVSLMIALITWLRNGLNKNDTTLKSCVRGVPNLLSLQFPGVCKAFYIFLPSSSLFLLLLLPETCCCFSFCLG